MELITIPPHLILIVVSLRVAVEREVVLLLQLSLWFVLSDQGGW